MQEFLAASGVAIAGGLLGAALHRVLVLREHRRLSTRAEELESEASALRERLVEAEGHHRQLSAETLRAMAQADAAARGKDRFLAAINHDLRQPLQAMGLALERLHGEGGDREAELARLHEGVQAMAEVLDGQLLLSQLDAGTLQPQAAPCALAGLFTDVVASLQRAAESAGVSVHCHPRGHAVLSDAGMLGGLLGRLLDNAIKATPRGGRVLLAARRRGDRVRIEVRDNGIGIAPVHHSRVFDEFFQVGNPERDQRKGLGLGLAVGARLAALLGTRIQIRSNLRAGSCFHFDLPRASAGRTLPHVLLVEGDPASREAIAALLHSWGHPVLAEATAQAAATGSSPDASNGQVDVLLCAVESASDPAWDLVETLRHRNPRGLCVVLCDALDPALLERATLAGVQTLLRPVAPSKLRSLLSRRPPGTRSAA